MKLKKWLLAASPIVLLATTATLPITSCSSNKTPTINSVEVRSAPINIINPETLYTSYVAVPQTAINVYHFNGSEVGCVSIEDYVYTLMQFRDLFGDNTLANYEATTENGITTITNDVNGSTCQLNYATQTLTFSDYDAFLCFEGLTSCPLSVGCGGGENYYYSVTTKYISGGRYLIDLSHYNIKAYLYEGKGYLPFDVFRNIINPQQIYTLFYNGKEFYEVSNYNSEGCINLYKEPLESATVLVPEFMEYTYNLLALTLDHRFGLKYRPSRANPNTTINYFPNGAYASLQPYHDRIVSLEKDVSNNAIAEFFGACVDDGGHAGYNGTNLLSTTPFDSSKSKGPEKNNTFATQDAVVPARKTATYDAASYWGDASRGGVQAAVDAGADNYYEEYEVENKKTGEKEKVAYITFDGFNAVDTSTDAQAEWDQLERDKGRELATKTVKNNCWKDTIRMTMWANDQIDASEIKNVVIDLSNNGGGTVYTEHFIASWLCGGVTEKIYNPHTNAYCEYTVKADIDGDGRFNADDALPSDVQLYVITTAKSFSCGNMLPCNLADNRPSTIFIGEPSGGGACFVDGDMNIGLGNVFRSSSNYHMLKNASKYNDYITVESGCPVNYQINPRSNPEKLYDRNSINEKIVNGL